MVMQSYRAERARKRLHRFAEKLHLLRVGGADYWDALNSEQPFTTQTVRRDLFDDCHRLRRVDDGLYKKLVPLFAEAAPEAYQTAAQADVIAFLQRHRGDYCWLEER